MVVSGVYAIPITSILGGLVALLGLALFVVLLWPRSRGELPATQRWAPSIALAFVVAALLALVAVPWAGLRRLQALQQELSAVIPPAREIVTEVQLSLALQGATLLDYGETRDTVYLARFDRARDFQLRGYELLRPLVARLGPAVIARYDTLGYWQTQWHASMDELRRRGNMLGVPPLRAEPARTAYEQVLTAIAELDLAIARAAEMRWALVTTERRREGWLTLILGGTALAAALTVAWLGRQLRVFAHEAERRRHEVERVMERKALFMRGLSHDLKNPLGAIDGYAELLEAGVRGELADPQRESVRRIRGLVDSLLALIDDVLEVARAEAGQLRITVVPTDLAQLVKDIVEAYRGAAHSAGLQLEVEPLPALPPLTTDPGRVRQVLDNLLSNAVKYTPSGGQVVVRAARQADKRTARGDGVAVEVCDTGPGIPLEHHDRIFEEFARLDPTARGGAGLGLAIARQIALLLGGDLTVTSVDQRGSTFTLWLPFTSTADGVP
jgi:signal transduction histidine kinase